MATYESCTNNQLEDELQRFYQLKLDIKKLNFIVGESALQNFKLEKSLRNKRQSLNLPISSATESSTEIPNKNQASKSLEAPTPRSTNTKSATKPSITIRPKKEFSRTHLRRTLQSSSPKRRTRESPIGIDANHSIQHTHTHNSPSIERSPHIPNEGVNEIQHTKRYEKLNHSYSRRSHYDRTRGRSPPPSTTHERKRRSRASPPSHSTKFDYGFNERNSYVPVQINDSIPPNKTLHPNVPYLSSPFTPLEDTHHSPRVSERSSLPLSTILPLNSHPKRDNHFESEQSSYQPVHSHRLDHTHNQSLGRHFNRRYPQVFPSRRKLDDRKPPRPHSSSPPSHRHMLNRLTSTNKPKASHTREDYPRKDNEEPNSPIDISSKKSSSSSYSPSPTHIDYFPHKRRPSPPNNSSNYNSVRDEDDPRGSFHHTYRVGNIYASPRGRHPPKFPRRRPESRRIMGAGKRYTRSRSPVRVESYYDNKPHKLINKNPRSKKPVTSRLSHMGSDNSIDDFADHTSPLTPS